MAITVGSTSTKTSHIQDMVITKPSGLVVGDLMVAAVNFTQAISNPGGWTQLYNSGNFYVFYKIATSGDVAASNFTFGTSGNGAGFITRITGDIDTTNPLITFSPTTSTSTATPTASAISGAGLQPFLLMILGINRAAGSPTTSGYQVANTNPSWTELFDSGDSGVGVACAAAQYSLTTTTGAAQATLSASADSVFMGLLGINSTITRVSVLSFASTLISPTTTKKIAIAILSLASTLIAPVATTILKTWSNLTKHAASWQNEDKS